MVNQPTLTVTIQTQPNGDMLTRFDCDNFEGDFELLRNMLSMLNYSTQTVLDKFGEYMVKRQGNGDLV